MLSLIAICLAVLSLFFVPWGVLQLEERVLIRVLQRVKERLDIDKARAAFLATNSAGQVTTRLELPVPVQPAPRIPTAFELLDEYAKRYNDAIEKKRQAELDAFRKCCIQAFGDTVVQSLNMKFENNSKGTFKNIYAYFTLENISFHLAYTVHQKELAYTYKRGGYTEYEEWHIVNCTDAKKIKLGMKERGEKSSRELLHFLCKEFNYELLEDLQPQPDPVLPKPKKPASGLVEKAKAKAAAQTAVYELGSDEPVAYIDEEGEEETATFALSTAERLKHLVHHYRSSGMDDHEIVRRMVRSQYSDAEILRALS